MRTLGELAEYVGGQVQGDPNVEIRSASTLSRAKEGEISFLANRKYEKHLRTTKASAVIASKEMSNAVMSVPLLIAEDPYYAFMQIMVLLHGHRKHKKIGISAGGDFRQCENRHRLPYPRLRGNIRRGKNRERLHNLS